MMTEPTNPASAGADEQRESDARPSGKLRDAVPLCLVYTNWRGETSVCRIVPMGAPYLGGNDWHPWPTWLLPAWDVDKQAEREFALRGFAGVAVPPAGTPGLSATELDEAEDRIDAQFNLDDPAACLDFEQARALVSMARASLRQDDRQARIEELERQLGPDSGHDCVECHQRIFGTCYGMGDGSGQSFGHPSCYWRREAERHQDDRYRAGPERAAEMLDRWETQSEHNTALGKQIGRNMAKAIRVEAAAPAPQPNLTTAYTPRVVDYPETGFSEWMLEDAPSRWDADRLKPGHMVAWAIDDDRFIGVRWPSRELPIPAEDLAAAEAALDRISSRETTPETERVEQVAAEFARLGSDAPQPDAAPESSKVLDKVAWLCASSRTTEVITPYRWATWDQDWKDRAFKEAREILQPLYAATPASAPAEEVAHPSPREIAEKIVFMSVNDSDEPWVREKWKAEIDAGEVTEAQVKALKAELKRQGEDDVSWTACYSALLAALRARGDRS